MFYAKGFIDLDYKPKKTDLVALFRVEPNGVPMKEACGAVAAESSVGTWTHLTTSNESVMEKRARVFEINGNYCKVAYPVELFEGGNMPQILSSVAGNIFGMKVIKKLRLEDISFPEEIIKSFRGPKYGLEGVREIVGVYDRPLVGTIVKPKLGLNESQHAKVAYESWVGGLDLCKEDENLASMKFNKFEKRVETSLQLREKAEDETGETKVYLPNVTGEVNEMLGRAEFVKEHGGKCVMVDILTTGWGGLQTLREKTEGLGLILHAHRAGHAAFTRDNTHGISMLVVAKVAKVIGVDQLHIGTAHVGKMEGSSIDVKTIEDEMEENKLDSDDERRLLAQDWYGTKPVFAVASGGLHPGSVPKLIERMGTNIIAQFGGGCHGHPNGTRAGAKAIRQAVDAIINGEELNEYASSHKELAQAIEKWGIV